MISVIVPIFNEEKYIARCIESIVGQDYPKNDLEVLFVDGMSTDRTRAIISEYLVKYPFIRLIDNTQRIVPPAMNIGIKAAKGDVIIRLDAHATFPSCYFSVLVQKLDELQADNVGGICHTLPASNNDVCVAIANVLGSKFGMGNSFFRIGSKKVIEVDTVPFGCFHRELFDRIGYFDEELIRNQDDEFNGRIIKNGGKIYLLPQLVIDYYARDTIGKIYKMFNQYGLFKPLVNKKLGSPTSLRQFFPPCFVLGLFSGPLCLIPMVFGNSCMNIIAIYMASIYIMVIMLYFLLATYNSFKDTSNLRQVFIQDWVFFVVHFSYGLGYLHGYCKLIFNQHFTAKMNR